MAAFGWTKGGNGRTNAGSVTDGPAAIRKGLINSYGFFMSLVIDILFTEFRYFTRKTKLVFCNLQIGGFHSDAMCRTIGLSLEKFF
jgi:hypothetical protein